METRWSEHQCWADGRLNWRRGVFASLCGLNFWLDECKENPREGRKVRKKEKVVDHPMRGTCNERTGGRDRDGVSNSPSRSQPLNGASNFEGQPSKDGK